MIFEEKYFSCYILLTDQFSLPDCLYFSRHLAICLLRLRGTHNALQLPVFFFLFIFFSLNIGEFGAKNYLQTMEKLIQYMILEIHFRSLKYTAVNRIRKNLSNFSFKRYEAMRQLAS